MSIKEAFTKDDIANVKKSLQRISKNYGMIKGMGDEYKWLEALHYAIQSLYNIQVNVMEPWLGMASKAGINPKELQGKWEGRVNDILSGFFPGRDILKGTNIKHNKVVSELNFGKNLKYYALSSKNTLKDDIANVAGYEFNSYYDDLASSIVYEIGQSKSGYQKITKTIRNVMDEIESGYNVLSRYSDTEDFAPEAAKVDTYKNDGITYELVYPEYLIYKGKITQEEVDEEMRKAVKMTEKVIERFRKKGFKDFYDGATITIDPYNLSSERVADERTGSKTAAYYSKQDDRILLNNLAFSDYDNAFTTLAHELAHRYHYREMNQRQWDDWVKFYNYGPAMKGERVLSQEEYDSFEKTVKEVSQEFINKTPTAEPGDENASASPTVQEYLETIQEKDPETINKIIKQSTTKDYIRSYLMGDQSIVNLFPSGKRGDKDMMEQHISRGIELGLLSAAKELTHKETGEKEKAEYATRYYGSKNPMEYFTTTVEAVVNDEDVAPELLRAFYDIGKVREMKLTKPHLIEGEIIPAGYRIMIK